MILRRKIFFTGSIVIFELERFFSFHLSMNLLVPEICNLIFEKLNYSNLQLL